MLKIGQNSGKIANYPPNVQQRFASLVQVSSFFNVANCGLYAIR